MLGCGMVDPNVFEFVKDNGYDPKKVSGFAFGMGVDRLALLKYGVDDIQLFFQGDVDFYRAQSSRHMTLEELANTLPSGFHDSALKGLSIDYECRSPSAERVAESR